MCESLENNNNNVSESRHNVSEDPPVIDPQDKGTPHNVSEVGTASQNISELPLLITAPQRSSEIPLLKDSSHSVPDLGVSKCLVHTENLSASWTYDSDRMALSDVNLEVNEVSINITGVNK